MTSFRENGMLKFDWEKLSLFAGKKTQTQENLESRSGDNSK